MPETGNTNILPPLKDTEHQLADALGVALAGAARARLLSRAKKEEASHD